MSMKSKINKWKRKKESGIRKKRRKNEIPPHLKLDEWKMNKNSEREKNKDIKDNIRAFIFSNFNFFKEGEEEEE